MTGQPLPDRWIDDARWLVQALDPRARLARLIHMSAEDYRSESFLDDRMLARQPQAMLCSLDELLAASGPIARNRLGWIFHIGHVGSTLVSRLLGEVRGSFAIREPRALRDLSVFSDEERRKAADSLGRILSRPMDGATRPVVKATSFVSEFAPMLVGPGDRALFLFATARNYVASILAGPNSCQELEALGPVRAQRLAAHGIRLDGADRTLAHQAAAAWLTEMASLERAAVTMGERVLWFDFDRMLEGMARSLRSIADHFDLAASDEALHGIAQGALMTRYSKAPQHGYSADLRRDVIADANQRFGADIDSAMDWLETAATQHPLLATAVTRAG